MLNEIKLVIHRARPTLIEDALGAMSIVTMLIVGLFLIGGA